LTENLREEIRGDIGNFVVGDMEVGDFTASLFLVVELHLEILLLFSSNLLLSAIKTVSSGIVSVFV